MVCLQDDRTHPFPDKDAHEKRPAARMAAGLFAISI
jgi:hypothetical protein